MTLLYFAYGSNMHLARLQARVDSAVPLGIARLPEYRLAFHKRGADGSGKGNIVAAAGVDVWGVVYSVSLRHAAVLDDIEGAGYGRVELQVLRADSGRQLAAFSYRARAGAIAAGLRPFNWYLDLLVHGAAYHGLPPDYVEQLRRVTVTADTDAERVRLARALLDRH